MTLNRFDSLADIISKKRAQAGFLASKNGKITCLLYFFCPWGKYPRPIDLRIFVAALAVFAIPAPGIAADPLAPHPRSNSRIRWMSGSLCQFSGKVFAIVNTASECGYTPQYEDLEKLYRQYRDKGFMVLEFPANDFGGQEPGSNSRSRSLPPEHGVTFPMFAKTSVVGANANPLYRTLATLTGKPPRWNFHSISSTGRDSRWPCSKVRSSQRITGTSQDRKTAGCALT